MSPHDLQRKGGPKSRHDRFSNHVLANFVHIRQGETVLYSEQFTAFLQICSSVRWLTLFQGKLHIIIKPVRCIRDGAILILDQ